MDTIEKQQQLERAVELAAHAFGASDVIATHPDDAAVSIDVVYRKLLELYGDAKVND